MSPPRSVRPQEGERTGTVCPICGSDVLQQETYGKAGARDGFRLVCSKRGCPWRGRVQ